MSISREKITTDKKPSPQQKRRFFIQTKPSEEEKVEVPSETTLCAFISNTLNMPNEGSR